MLLLLFAFCCTTVLLQRQYPIHCCRISGIDMLMVVPYPSVL